MRWDRERNGSASFSLGLVLWVRQMDFVLTVAARYSPALMEILKYFEETARILGSNRCGRVTTSTALSDESRRDGACGASGFT